MKRNRTAIACLTAGLALGLSARGQSVDDPRLRVETWAGGLTRPTQFAFIDAGEVLVWSANTGQIRHVVDGSVIGVVLDVPVTNAGALGIVVDPDFDGNGFVYVYRSAADGVDGGTWTDNRVERYRWNGSALVEGVTLISFPDDPPYGGPDHNSGALRFGPDGMLYGQVGDKRRGGLDNPRIEQNTSATVVSGMGGIFRIAPDGSIPVDNPFRSSSEPLLRPWYVYGFRNSFGMDFDLLSGILWFGENGPTQWDELNRADAGMNSGWRKLMGPDARDATYEENQFTAYDAVDLVQLRGSFYRDPEFSWTDCIGVAGMAFLHSKRFPEDLWDTLIVGETNYGQLHRFDLDPTRQHFVLSGALSDKVADDAVERDLTRFGSDFWTATQVVVGPDGYLYVSGYWDGEIWRVRPLVDLFEPFAFVVEAGTLEAGGVSQLESSDDRRVRIGPQAPEGPLARREFVLSFQLNGTAPERIDLVVESRGSRAAQQSLELWDPLDEEWVQVDVRRLSTSDSVVTLTDLPSPTAWVDAQGVLRVRIAARAPSLRTPVPVGQPPAGNAGRFRLFVDQVRLLVTWP